MQPTNLYDTPEVQKNRWKIFISISLFTFMATLDGSIVNIALPTIAQKLSIPTNQSIWVVSIYVITICVFLILFGKLGDIFGKIKIFRIGTFIFVFGTFLAGLSDSLTTLIFARIVQAFGASMTMSTNLGIITEIFPPQTRGKALGLIGSVVSLGTITGPSIGGVITHYLSWSYIFWLNVPFGLLTIFLGFKYLPRDILKAKSKMDFVGFCIYASFIILFFGTMFAGQDVGFDTPFIWLLLVISLISIFAFIKYEKKTKMPLLDFSIFKNSSATIGLICGFVVFGANFFYAIITPFYLQVTKGYSPSAAGFIMMIFPIVMVIAAPIAGSLTSKIKAEKMSSFGLFIILSVHALLCFLDIETHIIWFAFIVGLNGLGNAVFQSPNNTIIMGSVEKRQLGIIGSLNALARNVGNIVGVTFATTILFAAMSIKAGEHISTYIKGEDTLFIFGMHIAFIFSFLSVFGAFALSLRQLKTKKI